jgi:hypothetical protein
MEQRLREAKQAEKAPAPAPESAPFDVRSAPIDAEQTTTAPASQLAASTLYPKRKRGDPVIIVPDSSESESEPEPESGPEPEPQANELQPLFRRPGSSCPTQINVTWVDYQNILMALETVQAQNDKLQARCNKLEAALECKTSRCIQCNNHAVNLCVQCFNESAEVEDTYQAKRAKRARW